MRWFASMLMAVMLAGCASLSWHKPQVSMAGVELAGGGLQESRVLIHLRVKNDNAFDFTLERLQFSLQIADRQMGSGERSEEVLIRRQAETDIDVNARVRTLDLLEQLAKAGSEGRALPCLVRGEASVRDHGSFPFEHRCEIETGRIAAGLKALR